MKRTAMLVALAAAMIISGLALLGLRVHKNITFVVDGKPHNVQTWALTTGSFLGTQGLSAGPQDRLQPPENIWLKDGATVRLNHSFPVSILADGKTQSILSNGDIAGNLLVQGGVHLYPGDEITLDGQPAQPDQTLEEGEAHLLQVVRAVSLELETPEGSQTIRTTAPTLGKALWQAGIILGPGDRLEPSPETTLVGPLTASYFPARPVTIQIGERSIQGRTAAVTVGEALASLALPLQELDYSIPDQESQIPANGKIRVVQVREDVSLTQDPLPFETEYQPAANVALDTQQILQTGVYGIQAQRVRVRYEDGEEITRTVDTAWLAQEPKNRIVGYGTKVVKKTLKTPGGQITYWRALPMYATSYSPCRLGVSTCNDVTASGLKLQKGVAGVAKSWYGFTVGQKVYVPGYGVATIADFGNGIPGRNLIDLGYSESDFVAWHQNVTVYFLWPPPANIQYILP
jgi:uncharacterized protein YabE (DUF348 family)